MECAVRVDGGLTDWHETTVGVLQGCILSPLLFNMLLDVVVALTLHGCGAGASISGINIPKVRFADDMSHWQKANMICRIWSIRSAASMLLAADLVLKSATLKLKNSVLARMSEK